MKLHYRTVFLSDLHLGSPGCQARPLAKLLKKIDCDTLYLVGDAIDMWRLKKKWHWPTEHNDVVIRILKMAKRGCDVRFIPGNHDEGARQFYGLEFGGVKIMPHDTHTTADGRELFITHGDQFDMVVKHNRLLCMVTSGMYEWLLRFNTTYNRYRAWTGRPYWSLSQAIKMRVKSACKFISRFETTLVAEAKRRQAAGVVCGHIHKAEATIMGGIEYYNCGDWQESCTLLVEEADGTMRVLNGIDLVRDLKELKQAQRADRLAEAFDNLDEFDDEADDADELIELEGVASRMLERAREVV